MSYPTACSYSDFILHTYIHTYMHACIHTHFLTHTHNGMHVCICMHVCMYACMHVCMYVCMYVFLKTFIMYENIEKSISVCGTSNIKMLKKHARYTNICILNKLSCQNDFQIS